MALHVCVCLSVPSAPGAQAPLWWGTPRSRASAHFPVPWGAQRSLSGVQHVGVGGTNGQQERERAQDPAGRPAGGGGGGPKQTEPLPGNLATSRITVRPLTFQKPGFLWCLFRSAGPAFCRMTSCTVSVCPSAPGPCNSEPASVCSLRKHLLSASGVQDAKTPDGRFCRRIRWERRYVVNTYSHRDKTAPRGFWEPTPKPKRWNT